MQTNRSSGKSLKSHISRDCRELRNIVLVRIVARPLRTRPRKRTRDRRGPLRKHLKWSDFLPRKSFPLGE